MSLRTFAFSAVTTLTLAACGNGGGGGTGGGQGGGQHNTGGGSGGTSTLTLAWSFDGRACAEQAAWAADAGIPAVATLTVELNGQTLPASGGFDCANGGVGNGVVLTGLADGNAAYTVHAWSAQHEELFRGSGSATINGATNASVTLSALKGGLAFTWYFWNGADYVDCADAGVTSLTLNLKRAMTNELVFGDAGTVLTCPTPFGDGLQLPWLAPGRYFIYLQARDATNALYGTDPISPPRADVDAGVYPTVQSVTQPAELYRQ